MVFRAQEEEARSASVLECRQRRGSGNAKRSSDYRRILNGVDAASRAVCDTHIESLNDARTRTTTHESLSVLAGFGSGGGGGMSTGYAYT